MNKVQVIQKTILEFDWHNFGLDEVGQIKPEYAEYAEHLARRIVEALTGRVTDDLPGL